MTYTDLNNAQEMLMNFSDDCKKHSVPCDGFHLSSGYCMDKNARRMVFKWNRDRIPNPKKLIGDFKRDGINLIANVKPWLLLEHDDYEKVAKEDGLILRRSEKAASGVKSAVGYFWKGGAGTYGKGSYINFLSAPGEAYWSDGVKSSLLEFGIESIWNDNNEFEIDNDSFLVDKQGKTIGESGRALQTLLMAYSSCRTTIDHFAQEAKKDNGNGVKRCLLVTRSGCLGAHRYGTTWSGDNTTSWRTMKWNIPMSLSLSLSGFVNCGYDTGGFAGSKPSREMFIRWIQIGIYMPRFSIHSSSWKKDNNDAKKTLKQSSSKKQKVQDGDEEINFAATNEPWMFNDITADIVRMLIKLRVRLKIFLNSLSFKSSFDSSPIIRPLVYQFCFDQHEQTREESFEFLLGPNLLVVPICESLFQDNDDNFLKKYNSHDYENDDILSTRGTASLANDPTCSVYFPGDSINAVWYDLHDGQSYKGGSTVDGIACPVLNRRGGIPLFLLEGTGFVVSGQHFEKNIHTSNDERHVYIAMDSTTVGAKGFVSWIEEDGETYNCFHNDDNRCEVTVTCTSVGNNQFTFSALASNKKVIPFKELNIHVIHQGMGQKEHVAVVDL